MSTEKIQSTKSKTQNRSQAPSTKTQNLVWNFRFGPLNLFWILCLVFCAFLLLPATAEAATLYWVGDNGDNVGTNANDLVYSIMKTSYATGY